MFRCSNQLSYILETSITGLEPATTRLRGEVTLFYAIDWWVGQDSNLYSWRYEHPASPLSYRPNRR